MFSFLSLFHDKHLFFLSFKKSVLATFCKHTLLVGRGAPLPFEVHFSIICCIQSRQAILTVFVALTELPQQGQMYFLVLDDLGGTMTPAPLCVPVPGIWKPVNSFLFMRISARSWRNTNSKSASLGDVCDHPYLSL